MIPEPPLRIAVAGAAGRMGRELVKLIAGEPERFGLAAAWVPAGSDALGRDAGEVAGCTGSIGVPCSEIANEGADVDVVIDFTNVAAVPGVARAAVAAKAALLSGVTGLDEAARTAQAGAADRVPVLHADNFSLGVAVLKELAVLARQRLGERFDVEIDEVHHRGKRDAPSGTARMLGRALGDTVDAIRAAPRENPGEIGYSVRRGGQVIGEHTVHFLGPHERLELTHRAGDRSLFAAGALAASGWLALQRPGQYRLEDYLRASE